MPPKNITAAAIDIAPPFTLQNFPPLPKIAPPRFGRLTQLKIAFDRCELPPAPSFDQQKVGITSSCSDEAPQSQSPAPSSTTERSAADRFVGTFELVEDVLSRLQLLDLLRARGTSTQFRDVVDKSSELQTILGLKPPQKAGYSMPLLEAEAGKEDKHFDCYMVRHDGSAMPRWMPPLHFSIKIDLDVDRFQPGSIARGTCISYPPLKSIHVGLTCHCTKAESASSLPDHDRIICVGKNNYELTTSGSKPEGLTLGDLLDIAERLRIRHVHCAWQHKDFKSIPAFRPSSIKLDFITYLSTLVPPPDPAVVLELQTLHEATYGAPPTFIDDETFELTAPRHHCVWPSLPPARSAAPASYITSRPPFLAEIRCFDEGVIIVGREGTNTNPSRPWSWWKGPVGSWHCAGERLAGTFELLESILKQLGVRDLLRAHGTSTQFRDVVDKSSDLQVRLGLKTPPGSYLHMPLLGEVASNENSIFIFKLNKSFLPWPPNKFSINITFDKGQLRLGSVARKIQLCHPPLTSISMTWWIEWPRDWDPECFAAEKYMLTTSESRTEGLTLGDLCDAAARVSAKPASTWLPGRRRLIKYAGILVSSVTFDSTFVISCPATENELEGLHGGIYGVPDTHTRSYPIIRSEPLEDELGVTDTVVHGQREFLVETSEDDVVEQPQISATRCPEPKPFVLPPWEHPDTSDCEHLGKVIFGNGGGIEQWTDPGTLDQCYECSICATEDWWDETW
ncbi:unnamed protein product [Zymoseptoria tritici ST99CH_1A5]|uniref:F-box domain-containing protein n=1 Tax=Zymoseptoria tritici ST99CH_1A5 TaxID=1276529 RepID=A0A1Y6LB22_ZYMTR|nr:unnamed protein product [Zymoseptoria tritici ST99CH_1A5]